MNHIKTDRIRRRYASDLAVLAALAAVVGIEIASLASAADELAPAPSGLVLDARDEGPVGLAIGAPAERPDHARVARDEAPTATDHATL
jgi:hypothetical protein